MSEQRGGARPPQRPRLPRLEPGEVPEDAARALREAKPSEPVGKRASFARAMPIIAAEPPSRSTKPPELAATPTGQLEALLATAVEDAFVHGKANGPQGPHGRRTVVPDGSGGIVLPSRPDPRARSGHTRRGIPTVADREPRSKKK